MLLKEEIISGFIARQDAQNSAGKYPYFRFSNSCQFSGRTSNINGAGVHSVVGAAFLNLYASQDGQIRPNLHEHSHCQRASPELDMDIMRPVDRSDRFDQFLKRFVSPQYSDNSDVCLIIGQLNVGVTWLHCKTIKPASHRRPYNSSLER